MLSNDMPTILADPSLLLFSDLSVTELKAMFTDAEAQALAAQAGFGARSVSELADEVSTYRSSMGWSERLPSS